MDARYKERFMDYVRRIGTHALNNWSDPMMLPDAVMTALKEEIIEVVFAGLALAGREWNSRQPVNMLPVELIGAVCAEMTLPQRARASHICTHLRSSIICNPTLWSVIDEHNSSRDGLPTFLERSCSAPVTLSCWNFPNDATAYWIQSHLHHIRVLNIGLTSERADIVLRERAPILESFAMRSPGYQLHSSAFGGAATKLTRVTLFSVRLPEETPVVAFSDVKGLHFQPAQIEDIDVLHMRKVFPRVSSLILDTTSCAQSASGPVVPPGLQIRGLQNVALRGGALNVSALLRLFHAVPRITVTSSPNVFAELMISSGMSVRRRLTWLHLDDTTSLDSIVMYESSEPWDLPQPVWRCFQRRHVERDVDLRWMLSTPAYTEQLTTLVIHDTFWPHGTSEVMRMPCLQHLTVLYAARLGRDEICLCRQGSATMECPSLYALCVGAIVRSWGERTWMTIAPGRVVFLIREILGFGQPTGPAAEPRKLKEVCIKNLVLQNEGREELDELAERIWSDDEPGWDGLYF